jgi:hypothetical protein
MNDEQEIQLFVSECLRMDTFIRMYISTGYSDREISSVLSKILKDIIERQPDPQGALEQIIQILSEKE